MASFVTRRARTPTASPQVAPVETHEQPTVATQNTARYVFLLGSMFSVGFLCYTYTTHPVENSLSNITEREIHASRPVETYRYPKAERLVAIGDLHGDYSALRRVLIRAGVLSDDLEDKWVGGTTVLVQVGDQQDRGDGELLIYDLLYHLQDEAPKYGGSVHILLGNHELMNAELYLRYVTPGGFQEFENRYPDVPISESISGAMRQKILSLPEYQRPRAYEVVAGGNLAKLIAKRQHIALVIGDSVFVHGGLSIENIIRHGGIEVLNEETRKYLSGETEIPHFLDDSKISPLWLRMYSQGDIETEGYECRQLNKVLKLVGAKRMIVGHTVQKRGINSRCGQQIWRADAGMAKYYGGETEALIISNDSQISILTMSAQINGTERSF